MDEYAVDLEDTGLEVVDLQDDAAFAQRRLHVRDAVTAATMANELAHEINNPLQGLINVVYIAAENAADSQSRSLAQQVSGDLLRLSELVQRLLKLPGSSAHIQ